MNLRDKKQKLKEGITVKCIGCKAKEVISFEAAMAMEEGPYCKACLLPMLAQSATVRGGGK